MNERIPREVGVWIKLDARGPGIVLSVGGVWRVRWRPSTALVTDGVSLRKTQPLYEHRSMYRTLSLTEVGVYGEGMCLKESSYVRAIGSKAASRCAASPPVLTRYTLLEMARNVLLPLSQNTIVAAARHGAHTLVPCGERREPCPNRKSISALGDSPADERKSFFRRKGLRTSTAMSSTTRRPGTNCWPGALSRCR